MCNLAEDIFKKYKISNIYFNVKNKEDIVSNICFRDNTRLCISLKVKDNNCQYKDLQEDLNLLFSHWGNI